MKCSKCQFENPEGIKFCGECGAKLEKLCSGCGYSNPPQFKFCGECGHDLSEPSSGTESLEFPQPSPKTFRPPHYTNQPEGERRQATILFSDLSGYTEMNERLDPEEVEGILRRIKESAVQIVESHKGIVNQFVGDEILALFGIPTANEDDPRRAIKAALELHKMVRQMSREVESRIGKPLTMHTGINSGLVVTSLSDDRDGLYGITGDAVNTGARLAASAREDEILVSQETQRLIAPYFETKALKEMRLQGKTEPTIPYLVIGESKIQSRFDAAEQKGFKAYTGRDQELATLHAILERTFQGEGQFVTVVGEAGVGKSRLLYEFRHSLDRNKTTVLEGRCQTYGGDTPYFPFLDAMRRGLQLKEEDSPAELLEKSVANIKAIDPSLEKYIPIYIHLLSIPSNYSLPEHLHGKELRKAMEEAFAAINILNTQHRPMVLILEDWHWSDEPSQSALKHLIGVTAPYPLMVVVTYRPEYEANWGYQGHHTPIVLKPLEAKHTENIIKSITGTLHPPEELVTLVHERTGGNPLFIEELCYSLIEEGVVVVEEGQAALTKSLENLSLPETVQAIIRTRLDRLDINDKEALRLASVIGRVFARRILERVHSAQLVLSKSIESLKSLDLIQQIRVLPEAEYSFRHVLTQTVVYETLLLQKRKELHGAIGCAIEELYPERLEEQAPILAYHYARSDQQGKAVHYAILAGDQATVLYANREATIYYEQALTMARQLQPSPEAQRWQIDAALKLAAVGITRQDIERDLTNLEQVLPLAEQLNDRHRLTRTLYWLGRINYVLWNPQKAMGFAKRSIDIADNLGDDVLAAPPVNLMGRVYWQLSDFVRASQMMERSVAQMQRVGNKTEESTASALAGYLLAHLGEFDSAFAHAGHGIQVAQELQNPFAEANAYHLRGSIYDQHGKWSQAVEDYQKARIIAEKAQDLFRLYLVKSWDGRAHAMAGDPGRGRELLEESLTLAEQIGTKFWLAWQKTALAVCLLMLGDSETGRHVCEEAIRVCEETSDKYVLAFAHRTLAEILFFLNPLNVQETENSMLKAIRLQEEVCAKPELARSFMSYARLLMSMGDKEKAEKFLDKAKGMFKHMGMAWDLVQATRVGNG